MRASKRSRNGPPSTLTGEAAGHLAPTLITREVEVKTEVWQGPLPSPETLERFRVLVPDAPERIFKQWEDESAHRRRYEQRSLSGAIWNQRLSLLSALTFALASLGVVIVAMAWKFPEVAASLGGLTIAAVVGAFMYGRSQGSNRGSDATGKKSPK